MNLKSGAYFVGPSLPEIYAGFAPGKGILESFRFWI